MKEKASKAEHAARLADPAVAKALDDLRALRDRAAFDLSWTFAESEAIERAIEQITTPGTDLEAGFGMAKSALDIADQKRQAVIAELNPNTEKLPPGSLNSKPLSPKRSERQAAN